MYLLGVLVHTSSAVLEVSWLSLLPILWFILLYLSGGVEMIILNETEIRKVLWLSVGIGAGVSPTQPLSLHTWWIHCVVNSSSLDLFLMSSLHAAVYAASADLSGERKI